MYSILMTSLTEKPFILLWEIWPRWLLRLAGSLRAKSGYFTDREGLTPYRLLVDKLVCHFPTDAAQFLLKINSLVTLSLVTKFLLINGLISVLVIFFFFFHKIGVSIYSKMRITYRVMHHISSYAMRKRCSLPSLKQYKMMWHPQLKRLSLKNHQRSTGFEPMTCAVL